MCSSFLCSVQRSGQHGCVEIVAWYSSGMASSEAALLDLHPAGEQAVALALVILLQVVWVETDWRRHFPTLTRFFATHRGALENWLRNLVRGLCGQPQSLPSQCLPIMDNLGCSRARLWSAWVAVWSRKRASDSVSEELLSTLVAVSFLLQQIPRHLTKTRRECSVEEALPCFIAFFHRCHFHSTATTSISSDVFSRIVMSKSI